VWRDLWAVYGLRSLSRSDPNYMGRYSGDWIHRDRAYHNGTVWAWLTGPFVTAFLKVKDYKSRWRRFAYKNFLDPLFSEQVYMYGLGSIGEIFDGDWPHSPDGCISQAWSVAEPLRAYVEDVLYIRPRYEFSLPVGGDKTF
ncbi:glycogen debranching protein, partial [Candidatus Bathyarchaeota archaeon]